MAFNNAEAPQLEGIKIGEAIFIVVAAWKRVVPAAIIAAGLGWVAAANMPKTYRSSVHVYLSVPELLAFKNRSAIPSVSGASGTSTPTAAPVAFEMSAVDLDISVIATVGPNAEQARAELDGVIAALQSAFPRGGGYVVDLEREIRAVDRSLVNLRATETQLRRRQDALPGDTPEDPTVDDPDPSVSYVEALILLSDAIVSRNKRLIDLQKEHRELRSGIVRSGANTQLESGANANFAAAVCAAIAAVLAANVVLYRRLVARRRDQSQT